MSSDLPGWSVSALLQQYIHPEGWEDHISRSTWVQDWLPKDCALIGDPDAIRELYERCVLTRTPIRLDLNQGRVTLLAPNIALLYLGAALP